MKQGFFTMMAAGLLAGGVDAVQIDLQSALDGSDKLTMFHEGTVNLVIITYAVDSINVSFVNAFLDATSDEVDVASATGGQGGWTYDRSAFKFPAELDEAGGNEYGLVSGSQDGSAALPLGSATHIIDSLTLSSAETSGSTAVFFELGARQPQVIGPPPTYIPYVVLPFAFPPGFPNMIHIGDSVNTNSAFEINYIPEPASLGLLALGGLIALRCRR